MNCNLDGILPAYLGSSMNESGQAGRKENKSKRPVWRHGGQQALKPECWWLAAVGG